MQQLIELKKLKKYFNYRLFRLFKFYFFKQKLLDIQPISIVCNMKS